MGLTDSQEQTKIDKFKSIVVKKVYREVNFWWQQRKNINR